APGVRPCAAPTRPSNALVAKNSIRNISKGPGIAILDSDAIVNGNSIVRADTWGIYVDECSLLEHATISDNRIVDCGNPQTPGQDPLTLGGISLIGNDNVL